MATRASTACGPTIDAKRRVQVCAKVSKEPGPIIGGPEDVCAVLREAANADRESLYALHLSSQNEVTGVEEVAKGTLGSVESTPREIFKGAILGNASGVILAHNHPSGDQKPSRDDEAFTVRINQAGRLVGVRVLDHVIVTRNGCTSLRDRMGESAGFAGAAPAGDDVVRLSSPPRSNDPATMTPARINNELDKLDAKQSKLLDELIAAGRGQEKYYETAQKDDALSREYVKVTRRKDNLRAEIAKRYGPGAPRRMPPGFKPRVKLEGLAAAASGRDYRASSALVLGGAVAILTATGAGLYYLRRRARRPWGRWTYPLEVAAIATSGWGDQREYRDGKHEGLDLRVPVGTGVLAVDEGVVVFAGPATNAGNMLVIDHENGFKTRYLHLSEIIAAEVGQRVRRGELVALSGDTGIANSAPHLHFDVRVTGDGLNKYAAAFGTPVGGVPEHGDEFAVPAEPLEKWDLSEHVVASAMQNGVHLS